MIGKINLDSTEHLVGSTLYCTSDTTTNIKVVTCSDSGFTLIPGLTITVLFSADCGTSQTGVFLNVNSTGAKPVLAYKTSSQSFRIGQGNDPYAWKAGSLVSFTYYESGNDKFWLVQKSTCPTKVSVDSSTNTLKIEYV